MRTLTGGTPPRALLDRSQPQPVREEATESLAYLEDARAVPALLSVLDEPDVRLRFWAVFALGVLGRGLTAPRQQRDIVQALGRMIGDNETPPGNWCSVGREALAMLAALEPPRYQPVLNAEIAAVLGDPEASMENWRWADSYSETDSQGCRFP